jgi:hypothetical protein
LQNNSFDAVNVQEDNVRATVIENPCKSAGGVLQSINMRAAYFLSDDIYEDLRMKHLSAKPGNSSVIIEGEIPFIDPALFAKIDDTTISKAAMNTNSTAGPSGLDFIGSVA